MAAKDVYFSSDARDRMLRGVNILANAVASRSPRKSNWPTASRTSAPS